MRELLIKLINATFNRLSILNDWLKKSDLPEFDLYEKKEKTLDFNHFFLKVIKSLGIIILAIIASKFVSTKILEKKIIIDFTSGNLPILANLVLLFLLVSSLFIILKIISYSYKISFNQFTLFLFFFCLILFWKIDHTVSLKYHSVDLLVLVLNSSGIICFISLLNYNWPKYGKAKNIYLEDNPLDNESELKGIQKKLIHKLKYSLLKDKYISSFTIGVIGPWGQGKSSFMNHLKKEIYHYSQTSNTISQKDFYTETKNQNIIGKQKIITIEYSPYLNHQEENLIEDFFYQLSNELNRYSSRLAKRLKNYAESLIDASGNNILKGIYSVTNLNLKNESSDEIYSELKNELYNLDLKIIISIDDLDRLNPKEVLQVLKLIRNTSNFPNFVFVVALDKEYIMNAINSQGDYANRNFIDKFFQLECHLPEIKKEDLINATINYIEEKGIIKEQNQLVSLLRNQKIYLFQNYIQNFRDVKKFVNQLHFEYNNVSNLFKEILIEDYLNMIFLKMRFPEFYRFLINDYDSGTLLDIKNGVLSLIKNESTGKTEIDLDEIAILINSGNQGYIRPNINNYKFAAEINSDKDKITKYNSKESDLIKQTLILMFAENSSQILPGSIRRIKNMAKLIYQQLDENDLSSEEVSNLISEYKESLNPDRSLYKVENLFSGKRNIENLIIHLSYIYPEDHMELEAVLYLTFDLLRVIKDNNNPIWIKTKEILEKFYNNGIHKDHSEKLLNGYPSEKLKMIFEKNFLEIEEIKTREKLIFLGELIDSNSYSNYWHFSQNELANFQLKLFEQLIKKDFDINSVNDYEYVIHCYYHTSRHYFSERQVKKIKSLVKKFFSNKNLNILIFELLKPEVTSHLAYQLNDMVLYIFETISNFNRFIKENYARELESSTEISEFLNLIEIVDNKRYIKFNFSSDVLIDNFKGWGNYSEIDRTNMKNSIELFFESDLNTESFNFRSLPSEPILLKYLNNGKTYMLFISSTKRVSSHERFATEVLDNFILYLKSVHSLDCEIQIDSSTKLPYLSDQDGKVSLKLISSQ